VKVLDIVLYGPLVIGGQSAETLLTERFLWKPHAHPPESQSVGVELPRGSLLPPQHRVRLDG
jgi:hypothetical protein